MEQLRKISLCGFILFGLLSLHAIVFAQDKKLNHLTVSYPSVSGAQAVLWVAKETGIFSKNGLDVDLVYIAGGPRSMAALLSGQLQVIGTGGNSLVAANLNGAKDAVLIATTYNTLVFSLMTRAAIKESKELKGKSLGVTGFGSLSDFTLRTLLKKSGLEPTRDVVIRPMGGYPEILASMQSGALDGGIISPPTNIKAQELGFKELIDAGSMGIEFAATSYGTTRRFIRDRRETVAQFTRSLTEAIHRFKTDKAGSIKIIQQYTKTRDAAVLEETYRVYALKYLPRAPYPTLNGVQTTLDSLIDTIPAAKGAGPETFVDLSFVQELEKGGWIARLYQ